MADCPPYGCYDNWEDIDDALCPEKFNGGMDTMILLKCGVTRDEVTEDGDTDVLDDTKIAQLITAGDAKRVPGLMITINAPSALTGPSGNPCKGDEAVNYDRTLTIQDYNVTPSRLNFWNSINATLGFPVGGMLIRECDAERVTGIFNDLSFVGGRQSPQTNSERQFFEYEVSYRAKVDDPIFETVPASFDPE